MHEEDSLFIKTCASLLKWIVVRQRAEKHRLYQIHFLQWTPQRTPQQPPQRNPNKNTRWTNPTIFPQRTTLGPLITPKQQPPKQQTFNAPFLTLVCTKVRINWPITIFLSPQICTRTKSLRFKRLDTSLILISSSFTPSTTASSVQTPKFSVHFRCRYEVSFATYY